MIIVDISVVILLLVLWSCEKSSRNSIYGSSFCNGVVGLVNILLVFVLVQANRKFLSKKLNTVVLR